MALPDPSPDTTVVVTGASSGIGEALARELAGRGHGLTLIARRGDALKALGAELEREFGVTVARHTADLARPRSRQAAIRSVRDDGRDVVGLCNNAGVGVFGPFHEEDPERLNSLVALNVNALHELTLAFLPGMVDRGAGAVLNVASILGHGPVPNNASYSASKAFVLTLSEAVHTELTGTGVSCTAFSPGPVRTDAIAASGVEDYVPVRPDLLFADTEATARAGVDAMVAGRRTAIPGLVNQLFAGGSRYLPRSATLPLAFVASKIKLR
jgi:short-subunit dehydrogenase